MISSLPSLYQRWAARRMFARWSPIYEEEVTENRYSAPDRVAAEAIKILGSAGKEKPRVLEVGIGTGLLAQQIHDALPCRIVGLDFSEDMLALCSGRDITELLIKCDVGKDTWPIESGSCDVVVSGGLLEYLTPEMLQHFMKEAKRVLQQNGTLISSYKPREPQQNCIAVWPGHSGTYLTCSYIPSEIEGFLQQNGFTMLHHSDPFKGCIFTDGSFYDYRLFSARS